MAKDDNLQKHTLNLVRGDFDKLQTYYPEIGASVVIRKLVHSYIQQIEVADDESAPEISVQL